MNTKQSPLNRLGLFILLSMASD